MGHEQGIIGTNPNPQSAPLSLALSLAHKVQPGKLTLQATSLEATRVNAARSNTARSNAVSVKNNPDKAIAPFSQADDQGTPIHKRTHVLHNNLN